MIIAVVYHPIINLTMTSLPPQPPPPPLPSFVLLLIVLLSFTDHSYAEEAHSAIPPPPFIHQARSLSISYHFHPLSTNHFSFVTAFATMIKTNKSIHLWAIVIWVQLCDDYIYGTSTWQWFVIITSQPYWCIWIFNWRTCYKIVDVLYIAIFYYCYYCLRLKNDDKMDYVHSVVVGRGAAATTPITYCSVVRIDDVDDDDKDEDDHVLLLLLCMLYNATYNFFVDFVSVTWM